MRLQKTIGLLISSALTLTLAAQSGIGVIPTNADYALHIKTSSAAQDPLRLEGLRSGTAETSVLVTDAIGRLRYRPAADLFSGSSLWINTAGDISPLSNRPVAIGQTSVASSVILNVNGNQRFEGASELQFRDGQNAIFSPTNSNYLYFKGRDYMSFRNRTNTTDIFTVRALNSRVGILNNNPSVDFEVSGTQRMTSDERLEFRDGTNYINSPSNNNNWYFHGQQYVVFRDRNDAVDILTVQANTDRVGILTRDPQTDFEVNGTQRMRGTNELQFGSTFSHIYARNNQDFRINGFTETNFMNRDESDNVLSLDANTERVGILTNDPETTFHIENNTSLNSTGGGVARIGDGTYLAMSQNQIGAYSGSSLRPLHLQQFGSTVVIGADNSGSSLLDARGSARIGVMPAITTDAFVLTANAAGDLRKMTIADASTAIGDNLGNHTATQNVLIEAEHEIRFNSSNKVINRFGEDIDIVDLDGQVHVHAEDFIVTNEAIRNIAHFDGNTRRVGFGEETDPDATIHIEPVGSDFPIRIEDVPTAVSNSSIYRRLLIDSDGYVYKARNTVNRNGITSPSGPNTNLRPVPHVLKELSKGLAENDPSNNSTLVKNEMNSENEQVISLAELRLLFPQVVDTIGKSIKIDYEKLAAISFTALKELHAKNTYLEATIQSSQQQQLKAMRRLEEKLAKLARQIDNPQSHARIINPVDAAKAESSVEARKTCSHEH